MPPTFEILSYVVYKLGLKNVDIRQVALSNQNANLTMSVPLLASGGGNFYTSQLQSLDSEKLYASFSVCSATLDSFNELFEVEPSFIKVDVEGAEILLLMGAACFLKNNRPVWLIEVSQSTDEDSGKDIYTIMEGYDYSAFVAIDQKFRRKHPRDNAINIYFFTDKHIEKLMNKGLIV